MSVSTPLILNYCCIGGHKATEQWENKKGNVIILVYQQFHLENLDRKGSIQIRWLQYSKYGHISMDFKTLFEVSEQPNLSSIQRFTGNYPVLL